MRPDHCISVPAGFILFVARIGGIRAIYHLTDRRTRLLAQGLLTPEDVASRYGVVLSTVHLWRRRGLLRAHPTDDLLEGNGSSLIPCRAVARQSAKPTRTAPKDCFRQRRGVYFAHPL